MKAIPFGGRAVLFEVASAPEVAPLWRRLRMAELPGVEEVVAGARTVLVVGDGRVDLAGLAAEVVGWPRPGPEALGPGAGLGPGARTTELVIPVVYDGPDLGEVAERCRMSPTEVVARHTGSRYEVGFLGFSPGFAYLTGGDPALAVPRREAPRTSVPAGSVALAGGMSAVYPHATPGGWQLIGRTEVVLFDPERSPPAVLVPGGRVRFVPVTDPRQAAPARAAPPPGPPIGAGPIEVLVPGPLTTLQDSGRQGHAWAGVPRAGAVDAGARRRANAAVGNPDGAAVLEATLVGPKVRFGRETTFAVSGAETGATLDGAPVPQDRPVTARAGGVLDVGRARSGLRAYLAVTGGLTGAEVLGSLSRDTLCGLGPEPLRAGQRLAVGWVGTPPGSGPEPVPAPASKPDGRDVVVRAVVVRAVAGPRADWVGPAALAGLEEAELTVSPLSDRTGVRLDGPEGTSLHPRRRDELAPEGMVTGAIQFPPGGQPIVLLANHPTTGGYPVGAVVVDEDVDRLAQARPGSRIRIRLVG